MWHQSPSREEWDERVDDSLWNEFHRVVNMTSRELEDWLRS
jgi:hypothetical protein